MNTSLGRLLLILAVWGLAAVAAGAVHLLVHAPPFMAPLLISGLTAALAAAAFSPGSPRQAVRGIGTRAILRIHLLRFIGFYFIWLQTQGRLPQEFAQRAGWGDVIAAGGSMSELGGLPLALVPLWIVPILLTSHLELFRRLRWETSRPTRQP